MEMIAQCLANIFVPHTNTQNVEDFLLHAAAPIHMEQTNTKLLITNSPKRNKLNHVTTQFYKLTH